MNQVIFKIEPFSHIGSDAFDQLFTFSEVPRKTADIIFYKEDPNHGKI